MIKARLYLKVSLYTVGLCHGLDNVIYISISDDRLKNHPLKNGWIKDEKNK